jgi:phosphocarrier protein
MAGPPARDMTGAAMNDHESYQPRDGAIVRVLDIVNKKGLHARASARFVQTVEKFNADVKVTRGGETVGGDSIMGLMMLSAGPGTTITVDATGPQAKEVIAALETLLASRFGEDD